MAEQDSTSMEIIKISAAELRAGRRVMICVFHDNIDENLTKYLDSSADIFQTHGDFYISFGGKE